MSNMVPSAGRRSAARRLKRWLLALVLAGAPFAAHAGGSAMLQGAVDPAMAQRVNAAISGGDRIVTLDSEWRDAEGRSMSGGNSNLGWYLGDLLWLSNVKVRCIGLCFSSAAHILIASRRCIVAPHARVALHVPILIANMDVTAYARARSEIIEAWRRRMANYNVPSDIVDRALWDRNGVHELSTYEMKRIGCEVE